MNEIPDGYVIYCKEINKEIPFGVVSENYECKAISENIPTKLKSFLVHIEDKRFYDHHGIDLRGISRAIFKNIKAGKIIQGGSTITQQLARNLLRDNRKTFTRKLRETIKAIQLEIKYTKDEIIDLYFNNIYFGKNIRGIRAAGLHYFGKEVNKLSQPELLYLLTILRGPNYYIEKSEIANARYRFISNSLCQINLISKTKNNRNLKKKLFLKENCLQTIKRSAIPFITAQTITNQKKILSTIDINIQNFATQFVRSSKYPVSIIAIKSNKVVAFASSFGTDYPFISRSNVGSTLKPLLYCHLRDSGISKFERFDALKNNLTWNVKEVRNVKAQLNLMEALYYSNNNSFINAANKINIDSSLIFLANVFNREQSDFLQSSILGATRSGISLFELAFAYSNFFSPNSLTESKKECLSILNKIFIEKLGFQIENAFLKTGTTNDNKERYAVLGNSELTFAVLRNDNIINDKSKEGSFMSHISKNFSSFFKNKNNYKWI